MGANRHRVATEEEEGCPFRRAPSRSQQNFNKRGGGITHHGEETKVCLLTRNLLPKSSVFPEIRNMEGSCPSSGKKFIFKNANSQKNVSRETAIFSTSLEFNNKRSNDSFSNSRVRNPIQKSPSAGKTPNTRDRSVEIHVNRSGNTRAFGKRGNISNIFNKRGVFKQSVSGPKEEWGSTSSDKPKKSEQISTLKMEGFHSLTHMLKKGDFLCKIDLKDAYFSVPLHKSSRKFVRFQWAGNLYEFGSLCFGLAPAPRIFTKILKTSKHQFPF